MSKPVIYFRADGNSKMGLGHVIRSLALAEMLSENFDCRFIIRNPLPQLLLEIEKVCSQVIQLDSVKFDNSEAVYLTNEILSREDILVLDGYHFESEYQKIIKEKGNKLVCIDDIHSFHFYADTIINHAPEVEPASYSAEPHTKFLLGLNYSLLRRPFLEAAKEKRSVLGIRHIFICFGGSDFNNLTLKAIEGTLDVAGVESVHVILGGANVHKSEISAFAEKDDRYKIYENVSGDKMLEVMKKCDLAIVPASSILYEIISVKMPVISGHYVENQINVYHGFDALNLIKGIGDFNKFDDYKKVIAELGTAEIEYYINQQNKYLDGKSRERFIEEFEALIPKNLTEIRKAKSSDLMTYFKWANDPFVRQNAINQEQIKLSDHKNWFENRLKSAETYMYVLEQNGEPVGQVRFDKKEADAIISYSLDNKFRGKGLGKKILDLGIEAFEREASPDISRLVGWVKLSNPASNKIFNKIEFSIEEEKEQDGETYNIYIKSLYNLIVEMNNMKIGYRSIGENFPPFIIAEMSGNHNGDINRALALVKAAAESGAHALKLQTYTADTITIDHKGGLFSISDKNSLWHGRNLYELYEEAHTPWEWHKEIFDYANALGMLAFSSPFDETAVDFLEELNVPAYKIASFESNHFPLLKKVAETGKPILISSGTSKINELYESVQYLKSCGAKDIIIFKCTSTYPSTPENTNVNTIPVLQSIFPDCVIGLSDHTMGIGASVAAVALGARVIEKHFTLSRAEGGVDSAFSLEPAELNSLVVETERAFLSLGSVQLSTQKAEEKSVQFKRSIYVVEDIEEGEEFTANNIKVIRPGDGMEPKYYFSTLGKKAAKSWKRGEPLQL